MSLTDINIRCVQTAQGFLPDEVGKLFVNAYFGKSSKTNVKKNKYDFIFFFN
jgi:predicted metalloendopeptidase